MVMVVVDFASSLANHYRQYLFSRQIRQFSGALESDLNKAHSFFEDLFTWAIEHMQYENALENALALFGRISKAGKIDQHSRTFAIINKLLAGEYGKQFQTPALQHLHCLFTGRLLTYALQHYYSFCYDEVHSRAVFAYYLQNKPSDLANVIDSIANSACPPQYHHITGVLLATELQPAIRTLVRAPFEHYLAMPDVESSTKTELRTAVFWLARQHYFAAAARDLLPRLLADALHTCQQMYDIFAIVSSVDQGLPPGSAARSGPLVLAMVTGNWSSPDVWQELEFNDDIEFPSKYWTGAVAYAQYSSLHFEYLINMPRVINTLFAMSLANTFRSAPTTTGADSFINYFFSTLSLKDMASKMTGYLQTMLDGSFLEHVALKSVRDALAKIPNQLRYRLRETAASLLISYRTTLGQKNPDNSVVLPVEIEQLIESLAECDDPAISKKFVDTRL
jgi:hypothetical protein